MKYYIATAFGNHRQHNVVRDALNGAGHVLTLDWTETEGTLDPADVAALEIAAVLETDFVCVLLPGGRGTHVESGVALGHEIPVMLHAPDEESLLDDVGSMCPFYYDARVARLVGPLPDYIDSVLHWAKTGEFRVPRRRA